MQTRLKQSGKHIELHFPYSPTLVEMARAIPGNRKFDRATKTWLFAPTRQSIRYVLGHFPDIQMDAGTAEIVADHEMVMASHRWFRTTDAAIQTHRDGPNLDAAGLSTMMTVAAKIFPDPSPEAGHKMWLNATRENHLATAPATALLSVRDRYGRIDNLQAGRAWQRMHLFATTKNLSMHPMNQQIEWADRQMQLGQKPIADQRLTALVGESGWQPTFAFRMGFAVNKIPPSPRRLATDCIFEQTT